MHTSISSKSRGHKHYFHDLAYVKRCSSNGFATLKTPLRDPKTEDLAVQYDASRDSSCFRDQDDSSSDDSFDSDTDIRSSYTADSNLHTSISSKSRGHPRYVDDQNLRERREYHKKYHVKHYARVPKGQEPYFESYNGTPRPYVPDVPRIDPENHEIEEYSYVMKWLATEKSVCGWKVDRPVIVQANSDFSIPVALPRRYPPSSLSSG